MNDMMESLIFFSLLDSLDSAFSARQRGEAASRQAWGGRLFAALEEKHPEWGPDMLTVYTTARQMLFGSLMRRPGVEFGTSLSRNPEGFLNTVLMLLRSPAHSMN